jgi:hypothetical protein
MTTQLIITENNLSVAWAKAFLMLMEVSKGECQPAVVSIKLPANLEAFELKAIRDLLDQYLAKHDKNSTETVAGTLFPRSMWNPALSDDAEVLFRRYEKAWPGIKKCPTNRNGVYFQRLMAFRPKGFEGDPVNQLRYIIETYAAGNHRRSALQASILDPTRDQNNNRQKGFPCLQQVSFAREGENGLAITGFYAMQYQLEKAYGNYLGLYSLGMFMAKQLGLRLTQMTCIASVLKLGDSTKTELQAFTNDLQGLLRASGYVDSVNP